MTEAGEGSLSRYNFCTVTKAARKGWQLGIVSQYTLVYCDQVREIGKAILQYSHCTYDTAQAGALGAGRAGAQARGTRGAGAAWRAAQRAGVCAWRCDTTGELGHNPARSAQDTATSAQPGSGLCTQADLWLCTWCTWPVFDSVLFLSYFWALFMNIIHHKFFLIFF